MAKRTEVSPQQSPVETLVGTRFDDVFVITDPAIQILEKRNGGTDTAETHVDYGLPDWVENLTLMGDTDLYGFGNELDNRMTGNAGDNSLSGLSGDDVLYGGGGNDLLDGGDGHDTAVFDGRSNDYAVDIFDTEVWVTHVATGETDRLLNVELLSFSDGMFTAEELAASNPPEPDVNPDDPEISPDIPDHILDALLPGGTGDTEFRWNADQPLGTQVSVSFCFLNSVPDYYADTAAERDGFRSFSAEQKVAALAALEQIASFTGVEFVETSIDSAQITFGAADLPVGAGWAYLPGSSQVSGDIWINNLAVSNAEIEPGGDGYQTIFHEIGHAMGLKHANDDPGLPASEDLRKFTVMSTMEHPASAGIEPSTYMSYDIAALRHLYGTGDDRSGDDVYFLGSGDDLVATIWDPSGYDTLDFSEATRHVEIDLTSGTFSSAGVAHGWYTLNENIGIALGTIIEAAIGGSASDILAGNSADNHLDGGTGNDTLSGGSGSDTFAFRAGWGRDVITDFEDGVDRLDFTAAGVQFNDLMASETDSGLLISISEHDVLLLNMTLAQFSQEDLVSV